MKKHLSIGLLSLGLLSLSFGQDNYGQWTKYREISVNTSTSGGASVSNNQRFFPMLVRLTNANFVFASALSGGADIRFAKLDGTHLPYQIERWDAANQLADVWVLMDTVYGSNNGSVNNKIRMYYGKTGAVDSSRGDIVFSTLNNFQGVFHLGEATNDTARDATGNRFRGIPRNRGGSNPAITAGVIGNAKSFLGDTLTNNGGSYRLQTSTGGNTFTSNALNFQNDSSTVNGLPLYTISTWMNASAFPTGTANRKGIITKSIGANNAQWHLRMLDPAIEQITHPIGDTMRVDFADGPTAVYKQGGSLNLATNQWIYVAATRTGPVGTTGNMKIYAFSSGGTASGSAGTSLTTTVRSDYDVTIGSFANDSGFFSGKLDEVQFSNIARDSQWLKLSYETQKPTSAVLTVGVEVTPPSNLVYRTTTVSVNSGVAMTADSVVSVNGTITSYSVSPALPAGLSLNTTNGIISGTPTTTVGQVATNYTVTATGTGGSTTAIISIAINVAPTISSNPVATLALVTNTSGKFGITATGLPAPTSYKWIRQRGVTIDTLAAGGIFSLNTRGDTLTITNPTVADTGLYKCRVVNVAGAAVSATGRLTVTVGILDRYVVRTPGRPFTYRLPENVGMKMVVENMSGRVVWSHEYEAGQGRVVSWGGLGRDGRQVSAGMYVVNLKLITKDGKTIAESHGTASKN